MKALLKKQVLELTAGFYQSGKNGKRRSMLVMIGYVILFLYAFSMLALLMGLIASGLCEPLVMAGMDWLYFAIMGIVATTMGVVGSIFNTYSGLYQAKDNEFLLSLPLRPSHILAVRMLGCYVLGLFFELLVLIPADVVYAMVVTPTLPVVLLQVLTALVLPLLALSISCILGWLIAIIAARMQGTMKTIVTVILSIGFIVAYYYVYMQAYRYLQLLLVNRDEIGQVVQSVLYPLYQMGLASCGNIVAFFIFAACMVLVFAVVYVILSRSFLHLTTTKRGGTKTVYRKGSMRLQSVGSALLKREFTHYTHSVVYMLNCSMGTVFFLLGAVVLLWQGETVRMVIDEFSTVAPMIESMIPLLAAAAVTTIGGMNYLSAPSVSLEGKQIWIVQTLPIDAWKILITKLKFHFLLTSVPACLFIAVMTFVMELSPMTVALIVVVTACYIWATASMGLVLGVSLANLKWTNEATVVKQGASVVLALLLNWVIVIVLGVGYYFLSGMIQANLYLMMCIAVLGLFAIACMLWLKRCGTKRFVALSA